MEILLIWFAKFWQFVQPVSSPRPLTCCSQINTVMAIEINEENDVLKAYFLYQTKGDGFGFSLLKGCWKNYAIPAGPPLPEAKSSNSPACYAFGTSYFHWNFCTSLLFLCFCSFWLWRALTVINSSVTDNAFGRHLSIHTLHKTTRQSTLPMKKNRICAHFQVILPCVFLLLCCSVFLSTSPLPFSLLTLVTGCVGVFWEMESLNQLMLFRSGSFSASGINVADRFA